MPRIAQDHYRKMKNKYRLDVAQHLATLAKERKTTTYGALAQKFGGSPRGWGDPLGGIAIRCHEARIPILSVLVVAESTDLPSLDAVLYEDLGLLTAEQIRTEQDRCFAFDWANSPLVGRSTAVS
jgi:hypothetical protein